MGKGYYLSAFIILISYFSFSRDAYPTHWWVGMKNQNLSLLIRGDDMGKASLVTTSYPGITIKKIHTFSNKNYLQIDLLINTITKPGIVRLHFKGNNLTFNDLNYELKSRNKENGKTRVLGVSSKDLVYLLMPDRFSNADPSNDAFSDLRDPESDRNNMFARHGGDLKGIENHFDYLKELGVTTIWCTPFVENDMPKMQEGEFKLAGFHGYWFTDHYKMDKRYGGNEAYKSMINAAHKQGLKIIHDAVYNHVGLYHWLNLDPPSKDWINQWPDFTPPSHRDASIFDPNKSAYNNTNMLNGWFVRHLPDLNLANNFVATYLIQNAIWLTEEFGFDGFRVDTYKYCDEKFLNNVNSALLKEFPTVTTFVEAWGNDVMANAYFVRNNFDIPFKHNAMGALDFPVSFAIKNSLTQSAGWTEGINKLYLTLAEDFAYKEPLNNCVFLGNHDKDRFFSIVGEDFSKYKMGMTMLLTIRGIPQLYYGDEILMKNFKNPTDQDVRHDFPGGWPNDPSNKFEAAGRTAQENEAFNFIKKLANYRKSSSALTTGKTMQYIPLNGAYVYFRYNSKQTVMVIANTGENIFKPDWNIYSEHTTGFSKLKNIITDQTTSLHGLEIKPKESFVFELLK